MLSFQQYWKNLEKEAISVQKKIITNSAFPSAPSSEAFPLCFTQEHAY